MQSKYADAVPAIVADMRKEREADDQLPPEPEDGQPELVLYRYRTESGGVVLSSVPLEEDAPPPIVDSQEPETDQHPRKEPPFFMVVLLLISILTLSFLIAIGVLTPYQQPEQRASIRVPAVLLPLKTFTTSIVVIPTGIKTYPATSAHGVVTITNGSILSEELPKGMIFAGKDGSEVITDQAVIVPAGSAAGYGVAYVSAHAAKAGAEGNIQAIDIDSVEGTSLYIRNLAAFRGGQDSYRVKYVTTQDRETALSQARAILLPQTLHGLLDSPCKEEITGSDRLSVRWTCQFVTFQAPRIPGIRVLHVQVVGKMVVLSVVYPIRPQRLETK